MDSVDIYSTTTEYGNRKISFTDRKYLSGKTTAEENAKLLAMMDEEDAAHAFDNTHLS